MYYVYEGGVQGSLIINTSGFKGEKIELIDLSPSCMNQTCMVILTFKNFS